MTATPNKLFRFLAIGDPHVDPDRPEAGLAAMSDLAALKPDLALVCGDLSGGREMGTSRGVRAGVRALNALGCPWLTAIGNHDLQAYREFETDAENLADFLAAVGRKTPWASLERDGIFFAALGSQRWRENEFQHHEVRVLEDQLDWFRDALRSHAAWPTVVVTHAPIAGSGLRTVPSIHERAGNAFVNHCHDPGEIARVWRENPQIVLWFSAHNHLSHDQEGSLSERDGTLFVHVGVQGRGIARGVGRHSRVVDLEPDDVKVWTYDHSAREMLPEPDWRAGTGIRGMAGRTSVFLPSLVRAGAGRGLSMVETGGAVELADLPIVNVLPRHDSPVSALCWSGDGRLYVGTEGGLVWEYAPGRETPGGLVWSCPAPISEVAVENGRGRLWVADNSGAVGSVGLAGPDRLLYPATEGEARAALAVSPKPVRWFWFRENPGGGVDVLVATTGDGCLRVDEKAAAFLPEPGAAAALWNAPHWRPLRWERPPGWPGAGSQGAAAPDSLRDPDVDASAAVTVAEKEVLCRLESGGGPAECRRLLKRAERIGPRAQSGGLLALAPIIPGDREYPVLVLAMRRAPASASLDLTGKIVDFAAGSHRDVSCRIEMRRGDRPAKLVRFPGGQGSGEIVL